MTNRNHDNTFTPAELDASLRRLGIQELQERLEFAPLLIDGGTDGGAGGEQPVDHTYCCVCKIGDPDLLGDDGMLPYPHMDPSGLQ